MVKPLKNLISLYGAELWKGHRTVFLAFFLSRYHKIVSLTCGNKLSACGNELLTCGNELLTRGHNFLSCGNEIKNTKKTVLCPFLGSVVWGRLYALFTFGTGSTHKEQCEKFVL